MEIFNSFSIQNIHIETNNCSTTIIFVGIYLVKQHLINYAKQFKIYFVNFYYVPNKINLQDTFVTSWLLN